MIKEKGISAFWQVSIAMIAVFLLQAGIFYVIFSQIDVQQIIERSTYSYYTNSLNQSAYRLEKNIVKKWASNDAIATFMDGLESEYWKSETNDDKITMNDDTARGVVNLLKKVDASGCFLILNEEMTASHADDQIYFVRDSNVWLSNKSNSDLTLELGDYHLAPELGLTLGINWRPDIQQGNYQTFDAIKAEVLSKYNTVEDKASARLAHWISKQDLLESGEHSFVYVRPIIDKYTNKLYGVLGIEIREDVVAEIVESCYLNAEYTSGFAVLKNCYRCKKRSGKADIEAYFGERIESVVEGEKLNYTKRVNRYYDKSTHPEESLFYVLKNRGGAQNTIFGIENKLNIYNEDSYYKSDDWRIVLLLDERNLHHDAVAYNRGIIVLIVVSIVTAMFLTIVVAKLFTMPIKNLVHEIEEMDTDEQIVFAKTGTKEIDLLKNTIEGLSFDVTNTNLQMQRLLEMIGHNVVIFEENTTEKTFSRTGRVTSFLKNSDPAEKAIEKYSRKDFIAMMNNRLRDYEYNFVELEQADEDTKIIKVTEKFNLESAAIFVKYVKKIIGSRIFHVYTDYTKEYLELVNLEYEKNHDPLTGLLSRNHFKHSVKAILNVNGDKKAAMIMWDLDNLKFINDMYGHDWGDAYLKQTAAIIGQLEAENALVSRFAGDEFFVFFRNIEDRHGVRQRVHEVQAKLLASELVISETERLKIRASVGICWYPDDADNYDELYKCTDFAMYGAKHSDKGSINEFDRELYEKEYIILSAKEELNSVIEKKLIDYAFQPIVDAHTGEVYGFEALMRPRSKVLETVSDLMLVARSQFKLAQIEQLTFECVLDVMDQSDAVLTDKKVFINSIASKTLPAGSEQIIRQKLKAYGDRVVIEITEAEEISDQSMAVKQGYKNDYNCMIAIDDFGSGYSSDKTLLKIKPDLIKIDMHLIRNIHIDGEKQQRVSNLIEYGRISDSKIVAEGVESKAELEYLISIGVDYLQGYYLSKPQFEICDIAADKKAEIIALRRGVAQS